MLTVCSFRVQKKHVVLRSNKNSWCFSVKALNVCQFNDSSNYSSVLNMKTIKLIRIVDHKMFKRGYFCWIFNLIKTWNPRIHFLSFFNWNSGMASIVSSLFSLLLWSCFTSRDLFTNNWRFLITYYNRKRFFTGFFISFRWFWLWSSLRLIILSNFKAYWAAWRILR